MRTILSMFLVMLSIASAFAQITITATDFTTQLMVGNRLINRLDTLTTTANIGTPGTMANTWNFSALNTHRLDTLRSVNPATTPYISQFPTSTHSFQASLVVQGVSAVVFQYLRLQTNLFSRGAMGSGEPLPGITAFLRLRPVPDEMLFQFPMTLGTTWTSTHAESTIITLPPPFPPQISIANHTITHTVDAHGSIVLPGGVGTHQALRIRNDRRTAPSTRVVSYNFLARNGASVQVTAADTLQPSSGTISISAASTAWSPPIITDVRISDEIPSGFALLQNYPNPFNPSTRITYQVAREGFVSIKVFNLVGQEVATLVSESKSPGTYALDWSADGIPSGAYFYKMESAGFASTRRMLVLK
jgi:hypothetical protein